MIPHLSSDGQRIALQFRLQRAARAMLHLGLISIANARRSC
jgi:hypothetical protein